MGLRIAYIIFIFFLCFLPALGVAGELVIRGLYQGRDLYVQNPELPDGGFATAEVFLNGTKVLAHPTSSAYTIPLNTLKVDDSVKVLITYDGSLPPKVINPQVLRPKVKFTFLAISVNEQNINWTVDGNGLGGTFILQRLVEGKWTIAGSHQSDNMDRESFQLPVTHQEGNNRYRIRFLASVGKTFYSKVVDYENFQDPVTFYPERVSTKLYLNKAVAYEVEDAYGNFIVGGAGKEIDMSQAETGLYYLIVGEQRKKFYKK
ncbi:hypothetical protein [Persicobacter sp. CCB-QB2]|uniref:hypothetical protein n=1 Tax=Persicobacter sp. CCB-QB2 TaxID=1561025 RepID=UPI0006A9E6E9|nr:hypothetical protein [Persicobacter sp. CCB-QB2]